jgi:predicted RNA-binding Zn-ribbon protein involved in translation (DUF1610 family)
MATNTNLTREDALLLLQRVPLLCPKCGKAVLSSRYRYKDQNTQYKCTACSEIYRPYKLI